VTSILLLFLYLIHAALLPLLLVGFIRKSKARLQGRTGPPLLQPFYDVAKLLRKGETTSSTTTFVFAWAPAVGLGAIMAALLMTPWIGLPAPLPGDVILFVYVMALAKFSTGLSALDTGSSFGAFAASREAAISVQTEPAILLSMAALAVHSHSSSLTILLRSHHPGMHEAVLVLVVIVALWIAVIAELSRMPVDDPTTHLELTMVHEALLLENSGPNLALMEYAAAARTALLFGLMAQIVLLPFPAPPIALNYVLSIVLIAGAALVLIVIESTIVKLRWRRIPNLLSFSVAAGVLACLLVALRG